MFEWNQNLNILNLKKFNIQTLKIKSEILKDNPLKDAFIRFNPVLVPKKPQGDLPVVLILAGFTGNGGKYFNIKFAEDNFAQQLDRLLSKEKIPQAYYVFVDALTFWGGSQFINSSLSGHYEDYIVKELVPTLRKALSTNGKIALLGGSSGGYGALHLASKFPHLFSYAMAIAPDCDFEVSLLPEFYQALPQFTKMGGFSRIKSEFISGELMKKRQAHTLLNIVGMTYCYASGNKPVLPVNESTAEILPQVWRGWLKHDPLHFLKSRKKKVERLQGIYLSVGRYDQFNLQYGSRKLERLLNSYQVNFKYTEFNGSHFDLHEQREPALAWLKDCWS